MIFRPFVVAFFSMFFTSHLFSQDVWLLDSTEVHVEIVLDSSLIDAPWDLNWGPDNQVWFTDLEYVQTYNPVSGDHDTVLFQAGDNALGLAIHPDLLNGTPYVFVAFDTSAYYAYGDWMEVYRYEYSGGQLINPLLVLSYFHAGEHAGARMIITQDDKLMITTADYWFGGDPLRGRTLRLNFDGSIPSDNPDPGSYEFTSGHRNPQGLVQTPNGKIYNSEHGQAGSDEINLLVSAGHYGWPAYDADNCIGIVPDSCSSPTYSYISPLSAAVAPPSGVDYYDHPAIPEFVNGLLVGTLWGSMAIDVYTLDANGDNIITHNKFLQNDYGRIRDVAVAPDGSVYFIGFDRQDPTAIYRVFNPNVSSISVPENKKLISRIYPNPASSHFIVEFGEFNGVCELELLSVTGKRIGLYTIEQNTKQFEIPTTNLESGIYFLQLKKNGSAVETLKLVVN